jgi:hypothetical protein
MALFGFQNGDNAPESTHTFATFIKIIPTNDTARIKTDTISWLPRSLKVRPLRIIPEPGINEDLFTSLNLARDRGLPVMMWGPYEIDSNFYQRGLDQIQFLETRAEYVVLDVGRRPWATDCIHAVSDLVGDLATRDKRGYSATKAVVDHLMPKFKHPNQAWVWATESLGISVQDRKRFREFPTRYWVKRYPN